jgi:hypothetical protein
MLAAYDDFVICNFFERLGLAQSNPTADFVSLQYPADPSDAQSCISSTQFLLAAKARVCRGWLLIGRQTDR